MAKHDGTWGVGFCENDRRADIRLRPNGDIQWNFPEKRDAQLFCGAAAASLSENVVLRVAVRANVITHVLNDAENRDPGLLKHSQRLHGNPQTDVLRRGN